MCFPFIIHPRKECNDPISRDCIREVILSFVISTPAGCLLLDLNFQPLEVFLIFAVWWKILNRKSRYYLYLQTHSYCIGRKEWEPPIAELEMKSRFIACPDTVKKGCVIFSRHIKRISVCYLSEESEFMPQEGESSFSYFLDCDIPSHSEREVWQLYMVGLMVEFRHLMYGVWIVRFPKSAFGIEPQTSCIGSFI